MKINNISQITQFKGIAKAQENKKSDNNNNAVSTPITTNRPSAGLLQAMAGVTVKKADTPLTRKEAEAYLNSTPAGLTLRDNPRNKSRENVINALCKGDEQAKNIKMQLDLINSGDLEASTVECYWATGKMNENLAKDIKLVHDARTNGKNVADVYVPDVKTTAEGVKKSEVGDVFRVKGEDKIYVKTDKNESRQLDMDKDMFMKLFPPAKRYTTQQRSIGDCYLVSTLGTLMNNPKGKVALYESIHQNGKDISVKFKNGYGEYKYENAELPATRVDKYSIRGSVGLKILEDAYGLDSVNKADAAFKRIMNEKIQAKQAEYEKAPVADKPKALIALQGHKQRLADYLAAKEAKGDQVVVCRDDNYFNIYYEEDENGLKFSDLSTDPDNKDTKFASAADFYRGSLGGYNFEVLERFGFGGFRQYNLDLETEKVKELMSKPDFNKNFIMTGGTRANGSRVENPVAASAGVFGFHAYTLEPQMDKDGKLSVQCTNPWNTSYNAVVSYDDFLKYYDSVSIIDVNSYGKGLPLEEQPVKYGKNGAIVGKNINDVPVIWYQKNNQLANAKVVK